MQVKQEASHMASYLRLLYVTLSAGIKFDGLLRG